MKIPQKQAALLALTLSLSLSSATLAGFCKDAKTPAQVEKEALKESNISEARKLNEGSKPMEKPPTEAEKQQAKDAAAVGNKIPGVKVTAGELTPPTLPPIKGFHPIKRALRPIENLEGIVIKLQQQIFKLAGPISALQPTMITLHEKMDGVEGQLSTMHDQLGGTQQEVTGVRSDIAAMRKDIQALKQPIIALEKPVAGVAQPLEDVMNKLNLVILAIFIAAVAISIGTPISAVILYKYRDRFFPGMRNDMPKVQAPEKTSTPPAVSSRR